MKTVRVIVLVAMGVSAFCGFAQEIAPGAGALGQSYSFLHFAA